MSKLALVKTVPKYVLSGLQYETIMGSNAYGVSGDLSDCDIYGFTIPPKQVVFPHLNGEIEGFGRNKKRFEQFQQHHIKVGDQEFDFTIYSIAKYFMLAMENNPNIIDSLFTPANCVTYSTQIGQMVRENRKIFLHKGSWFKFKGYSYSQLHKMSSRTPEPGSNREKDIQKFGFDRKYAYHVVRLLGEVEQILTLGDIDLQRDAEMLKGIRRGEWTEEQVRQYFTDKEKFLEKQYEESKIPFGPDEEKIKTLLLNCLEQWFGNLDKAIYIPNKTEDAIKQIMAICESTLK